MPKIVHVSLRGGHKSFRRAGIEFNDDNTPYELDLLKLTPAQALELLNTPALKVTGSEVEPARRELEEHAERERAQARLLEKPIRVEAAPTQVSSLDNISTEALIAELERRGSPSRPPQAQTPEGHASDEATAESKKRASGALTDPGPTANGEPKSPEVKSPTPPPAQPADTKAADARAAEAKPPGRSGR